MLNLCLRWYISRNSLFAAEVTFKSSNYDIILFQWKYNIFKFCNRSITFHMQTDKHYIINRTALFSNSFAMKSKKVYSHSIHSVSVYLDLQMHWFAKKYGENGEESIQYPFCSSKYWLEGLRNDITRPTNTDITSNATKHKISKMTKKHHLKINKIAPLLNQIYDYQNGCNCWN